MNLSSDGSVPTKAEIVKTVVEFWQDDTLVDTQTYRNGYGPNGQADDLDYDTRVWTERGGGRTIKRIPQENAAAQPVFVPTYECYHATAERATDTELETMLSLYHRQACRVTDPHVRQACTDAARACEDEQLARHFERTEGGAE